VAQHAQIALSLKALHKAELQPDKLNWQLQHKILSANAHKTCVQVMPASKISYDRPAGVAAFWHWDLQEHLARVAALSVSPDA